MALHIFIPNKSGSDVQHLVDVGLEDLLRLEAGDSGPRAGEPLVAGPGGQRGVIFSWGLPLYKPSSQTWTPAKPDPRRQLAAARFWVGVDEGQPLGPAELRRDADASFDGYQVTLADGNVWAIPNGMLLPCRFALDDAGKPQKVPARAVEKIHERTLWAFHALEQALAGEAGVPFEEALDYAAWILSLNYRVNLEICLLLELFDDSNLSQVLKASTDFRRLVEISQKKTAAPTSAG